ncbi:MAG: L-histidine N(alpha)-methyltransferase [Bacteroidota bacterium]
MTMKTAAAEMPRITNYLTAQRKSDTIRELLQGLLAERKFINSKYFYNKEGSRLFEKITQLEEYYPTRTEKALIHKAGNEIANFFKGNHIIELGSGDHRKIALFMEAFTHTQRSTFHYTPVDVSDSALQNAARMLTNQFPELTIESVVADFTTQLALLPNDEQALWCFFGSTLGNFTRKQRANFLLHLSQQMKNGDQLLLGLDNVKDKEILERAYNDKKSITAAFNKNILLHVNQLLGTHIDPDGFEHLAFFNESKHRIEMHLKALRKMEIKVPLLPKPIYIAPEETIHTENSYKFKKEQIEEITQIYGFTLKQLFTDEKEWFSLLLLEKN